MTRTNLLLTAGLLSSMRALSRQCPTITPLKIVSITTKPGAVRFSDRRAAFTARWVPGAARTDVLRSSRYCRWKIHYVMVLRYSPLMKNS
ncbi:hypothetical protein KCP78_06255 [Salmonella enterica subsp. enterica]|nr:hypothetical protein KCP78_06255 [Salmonella enterica subsp. enterica]